MTDDIDIAQPCPYYCERVALRAELEQARKDRDEARKLAADAAHELANERQVGADLRERVEALEANAVRMREYRFALEGIKTDGKGNPL